MYNTSNFRYLRVGKKNVVCLNLLLAKDDITWFNDYSFQEILTILKPIILGRIELHNHGHLVTKGSSTNAIDPYNSVNDGLEDAGVTLGGNKDIHLLGEEEDPNTPITISETTTDARRRRRRLAASHPAGNRPQFTVRYGFRETTASERSGAVMTADKNLRFSRIKKEEGVAEDKDGTDDLAGVAIREEDESDNLRVSDFSQPIDETGGDDVDQDNEDEEEDEEAETTTRRGRRQRSRKEDGNNEKSKRPRGATQSRSETSGAAADEKPTLKIAYTPLKIHSLTLFIAVKSVQPTAMEAFATSVTMAAESSSVEV